MKFLFLLLLALSTFAFADPITDVKKEYEVFVENDKNDSLEILKQFMPDCRITFVESDGKLEFPHVVSMDQFKAIVTETAKNKDRNKDTHEKVKFTQVGDAVRVSGESRNPEEPDSKGSFSMLFQKAGDFYRIAELAMTTASPVTEIASHDLFSFSMPGSWKHQAGEMIELGDGKRIFPAHARSERGTMSYVAFESDNQKIADLALDEYPMAVAEPIITKLLAIGAVESGKDMEALEDGGKNRIFYSYEFTSPDGSPAALSGIVVRTEARIYTILFIGGGGNTREFWQAVGRTFKEELE